MKKSEKNKKKNPAHCRYLFPKDSQKEIERMEADYAAAEPAALTTLIPDKVFQDPIAAKQLQYDTARIITTMAPNYEHGKKMKGRHPGSIVPFSHILDTIYSRLLNEEKKPSAWNIFLALHKQQSNYNDPISGEQLFTVDKTTKTIHIEGQKKPMVYRTFCNRVTDTKTRVLKM